jgi:hypothetical protein
MNEENRAKWVIIKALEKFSAPFYLYSFVSGRRIVGGVGQVNGVSIGGWG